MNCRLLAGFKTKSKSKKDPSAPKRPLSAWNIFIGEQNKNKVNSHLSFEERTRSFSDMWKQMDKIGKKKYLDLAMNDKLRYELEYEKYKKRTFLTQSKHKFKKVKKKNFTRISGYHIFINERHIHYKNRTIQIKGSSLTAMIAKEWSLLPKSDKEKYIQKAKYIKEKILNEYDRDNSGKDEYDLNFDDLFNNDESLNLCSKDSDYFLDRSEDSNTSLDTSLNSDYFLDHSEDSNTSLDTSLNSDYFLDHSEDSGIRYSSANLCTLKISNSNNLKNNMNKKFIIKSNKNLIIDHFINMNEDELDDFLDYSDIKNFCNNSEINLSELKSKAYKKQIKEQSELYKQNEHIKDMFKLEHIADKKKIKEQDRQIKGLKEKIKEQNYKLNQMTPMYGYSQQFENSIIPSVSSDLPSMYHKKRKFKELPPNQDLSNKKFTAERYTNICEV